MLIQPPMRFRVQGSGFGSVGKVHVSCALVENEILLAPIRRVKRHDPEFQQCFPLVLRPRNLVILAQHEVVSVVVLRILLVIIVVGVERIVVVIICPKVLVLTLICVPPTQPSKHRRTRRTHLRNKHSLTVFASTLSWG